MMTAGMHLTSSRRLIFSGLVIALEFVHYHRRANAVRQFNVRSRDVLMNTQCPHKWWSTLKSAVFGSSSDLSLPPLIGVGGGLVCQSVWKAQMLSAHFERKQ